MGFKYHGQDPFLRAVDDALLNFQREANGHAVTHIQRQAMISKINMVGALISSPNALNPPVVAKTRELVDDLLQLSPPGTRAGMRQLPNLDDIRPRKPYTELISAGGMFRLRTPGAQDSVVANGPFVFVIMAAEPWVVRIGERATGGHTAISRGGNVYFAGEIEFNNGALQRWTNDSGHYAPDTALHQQVTYLLPANRYVQAF